MSLKHYKQVSEQEMEPRVFQDHFTSPAYYFGAVLVSDLPLCCSHIGGRKGAGVLI